MEQAYTPMWGPVERFKDKTPTVTHVILVCQKTEAIEQDYFQFGAPKRTSELKNSTVTHKTSYIEKKAF